MDKLKLVLQITPFLCFYKNDNINFKVWQCAAGFGSVAHCLVRRGKAMNDKKQ